jgi:hypothetical protein
VGHEPFFYELHHVHCHHVENCSPDDWQTPLSYDRLSLSNYLDYNFCLLTKQNTGITLLKYFYKKKKNGHLLRLIGCIFFRIIFMKIIFDHSKIMFLCRLFLLVPDGKGSEIAWAEHGLIDVTDLTNAFSCSTTYLENEVFGHDPLSNWFHCEHHQYGSRHWSLLRSMFTQNKHDNMYDAYNGNIFLWNKTSRKGMLKYFVNYRLDELKRPITCENSDKILYERTRPYRVINKITGFTLEKLHLSNEHRKLDRLLLPLWNYLSKGL